MSGKMMTVNINRNSSKIPTLVMKFGGTSVGSPNAMRQVIEIISSNHSDWPHTLVVTSAIAGATNLLLEGAAQAVRGDIHTSRDAAQTLSSKHFEIIEGLISPGNQQDQIKQEISRLIAEFTEICRAMAVLGETTARAMDAVAALGECMSVRILSAGLESAGISSSWVEATQLIVTDDCFQSAHPDLKATTQKTQQGLEPILARGQVPVVTGFIAATPGGITTTLGRGGSDFSAAILAAALAADELWIWTDVDGVMTADPRVIPEAHTISRLTYREVAELAYFGAKVLHPKTIRPVIDTPIGVRICNTFNPQNPGTRLVAEEQTFADGVIKAVTAIHGLQMITIEGRGMLGVVGVAARTFSAVAETDTSVPFITQASSEQSICFAVPISSAPKVIHALERTFAKEIASRDIDRVWASEEIVIVTIVGAGMRTIPGVAGRIFSALGEQRVNVIAIAQGSSEVSISLVIAASESKKAVQAIHGLII
jgi:bifunctional aspartokinase / homoserine dehydrogenase 1